jgi:DNA helicase-4
MQNPEQYKKRINAHQQVDKPQVILLSSEKKTLNSRIGQLITQIKTNDQHASIAVLARYKYLLDEAKSQLASTNIGNIHYWTFHGAKGLEADYCLIVGLFGGKNGFPNENNGDELVEALLPTVDGYKNSEERRLFYVAITRAKKQAFLIADAKQPSEFVEELLSPNYQIKIVSDEFEPVKRASLKCPTCETGYFSLKSGQYGEFYQCSNQATCQVKVRLCQECQSPSVDKETDSICQRTDCQSKIKLCQKCGRAMQTRKSQYGDFWGCTGFSSKVDQCTHTERADLVI